MNHDPQSRTGQAVILSGLALAMVLALGLTLGTMAAVLAAITLPVPLVLLWMSLDVFRADELHPAPVAARVVTADRGSALTDRGAGHMPRHADAS